MTCSWPVFRTCSCFLLLNCCETKDLHPWLRIMKCLILEMSDTASGLHAGEYWKCMVAKKWHQIKFSLHFLCGVCGVQPWCRSFPLLLWLHLFLYRLNFIESLLFGALTLGWLFWVNSMEMAGILLYIPIRKSPESRPPSSAQGRGHASIWVNTVDSKCASPTIDSFMFCCQSPKIAKEAAWLVYYVYIIGKIAKAMDLSVEGSLEDY